MRSAVVAVATMVLVGVFSVSAFAKARDVDATATAAGLLGVPAALTRVVGRLLPIVELGLCASLIIGLFVSPVRRAAALGSLFLLGAFTVAMARTLRRGQAPVCRCFGSLSERPISSDTIIRNTALGALAVVSAVG